jgi:hypothetical protein
MNTYKFEVVNKEGKVLFVTRKTAHPDVAFLMANTHKKASPGSIIKMTEYSDGGESVYYDVIELKAV